MDKTYQDIHILDELKQPIFTYRKVEILSIDFGDDLFVLRFIDDHLKITVDVPIKKGMKLLID